MTIKDELIALQEQSGGFLRAATVVTWARANPDSALHKALNWNDEEAAHEYRLWQVRQMIKVNVVNVKGIPQMVSLSIDRVETGGGYRRLDDVLAQPDLRSVLLRDALAELERIENKYATLQELARVWEAAEEARGSRGKRKNKKERPTAAPQA